MLEFKTFAFSAPFCCFGGSFLRLVSAAGVPAPTGKWFFIPGVSVLPKVSLVRHPAQYLAHLFSSVKNGLVVGYDRDSCVKSLVERAEKCQNLDQFIAEVTTQKDTVLQVFLEHSADFVVRCEDLPLAVVDLLHSLGHTQVKEDCVRSLPVPTPVHHEISKVSARLVAAAERNAFEQYDYF